jgi:predicted ester cyclase
MNCRQNLSLRTLPIVILASLAVARAQQPSLPQSPAEIARWVVEDVWNRGDFHLASQLVMPSLVLHFRGRSILMTFDAATQTVRNWREAFPDFHFRLEDMIVDGNRVALRIPFTGTHQGKFMGLEPTGKKIDVSETLILRIEDHKLAEMWEDYDEYGLRLQLGLVKPN